MAFNIEEFLKKNEATLPKEDLDEIRRGYLAGSDYQRFMNTTKTDHARRLKEIEEHEAKLLAWETDAQEAMRVRAEIEQRFGPVDRFLATADPRILSTPSGDFVARADVEKLIAASVSTVEQRFNQMLGQVAEGAIQLSDKMPRFQRDFERRYGRDFDGGAFRTFINDNNIADLDLGYKLFTSEDERKFTEDKHAKELEAAKAEGAREFATRHHIPEVSRTSIPSPILRLAPRPLASPQPAVSPAAPLTPSVPAAPSAMMPSGMAPDKQQEMQRNFEKALAQ